MGSFSTGLSAGVNAAMDALSTRPSDSKAALSTQPLNSMDALSTQPSTGIDKTVKAAKDFESLLLGQILKSSHEENGWLDSDDDDAGSAAIGLGEEQLARTMANNGGIGLSKMIEKGLQAKTDAVSASALTSEGAAGS